MWNNFLAEIVKYPPLVDVKWNKSPSRAAATKISFLLIKDGSFLIAWLNYSTKPWKIQPLRFKSRRELWISSIPKELYTINGLPLYIIIAKAITACGWWYAPSVMRYTLKRDDIPLLSQWIKKSSFRRTRIFWLGKKDLLLDFARQFVGK